MARRLAALMPFYEYDEERFFRSDDAPDDVAARRRAGFMRLARALPDALRRDRRSSPPRSGDGISDLQFTDAYRVPFQYSRFVREHLQVGVVRAVVVRRDGHRSRRQRASTT